MTGWITSQADWMITCVCVSAIKPNYIWLHIHQIIKHEHTVETHLEGLTGTNCFHSNNTGTVNESSVSYLLSSGLLTLISLIWQMKVLLFLSNPSIYSSTFHILTLPILNTTGILKYAPFFKKHKHNSTMCILSLLRPVCKHQHSNNYNRNTVPKWWFSITMETMVIILG